MAKKKRHPMQPIELDSRGVARFRENAIVSFLVECYPDKLNALAVMPWSDADYEQLMQLIGYSVSGYCDLSRTSARSKDRATEKANALGVELPGQLDRAAALLFLSRLESVPAEDIERALRAAKIKRDLREEAHEEVDEDDLGLDDDYDDEVAKVGTAYERRKLAEGQIGAVPGISTRLLARCREFGVESLVDLSCVPLLVLGKGIYYEPLKVEARRLLRRHDLSPIESFQPVADGASLSDPPFAFSIRTLTSLRDIETVAELCLERESDLLKIPHLGRTTLGEIKHALWKHGRHLKVAR